MSKIDELVAKHVMGWERRSRKAKNWHGTYSWRKGGLYAMMVPAYSQSSELGVRVMDEMRKKEYFVTVQNCHESDEWCALVAPKHDDGAMGEGKGEFAYAVSCAALGALGVK